MFVTENPYRKKKLRQAEAILVVSTQLGRVGARLPGSLHDSVFQFTPLCLRVVVVIIIIVAVVVVIVVFISV